MKVLHYAQIKMLLCLVFNALCHVQDSPDALCGHCGAAPDPHPEGAGQVCRGPGRQGQAPAHGRHLSRG